MKEFYDFSLPLTVAVFMVKYSVVDKPVDKSRILSTVSSTRPVLEALVDKPVDKTPISSTVSSTRPVFKALVDKSVDKTPIISTISSTKQSTRKVHATTSLLVRRFHNIMWSSLDFDICTSNVFTENAERHKNQAAQE